VNDHVHDPGTISAAPWVSSVGPRQIVKDSRGQDVDGLVLLLVEVAVHVADANRRFAEVTRLQMVHYTGGHDHLSGAWDPWAEKRLMCALNPTLEFWRIEQPAPCVLMSCRHDGA
jgi:hypothetical protein